MANTTEFQAMQSKLDALRNCAIFISNVTLILQLLLSRLIFSQVDAGQPLSTQFSLKFPHQCHDPSLTKITKPHATVMRYGT